MAKKAFSAVLEFLGKIRANKELNDQPDAALLERFRADRDEAAFAVLVHRHGLMVLNVCQRVLGNAHSAEDAFQATFTVLVRRVAAVRKQAPLAGWLFGVAQRVALKARSRAALHQSHLRELSAMPRTESPEDQSWQELRSVLDEEIGRLPQKCQSPLVLCYLEGKSYDQAALELGVPKRSLARRLAQGRELLREHLVQRGITVSAAALVTALTEKTAEAKVGAMLTLNTVKAAAGLAAGKTVAETILSAQAIALAEEVMLGMTAMKTKLVLVVVACGLALGGASVAAYRGFGRGDAAPERADQPVVAAQTEPGNKEAPPQPQHVDRVGPPLPPGALNRLGSQRFRNSDLVGNLAFSPDGNAIASACADGSVHLWEAATGKLRWRIATDAVKGPGGLSLSNYPALAFSADGKSVAALNFGGYMVIETATGKATIHHKLPPTQNFGAQQYTIVGAISPDLTAFALGSRGAPVHLYDAATGQEKQGIGAKEKAASELSGRIEFSGDGKTIFASANQSARVLGLDTFTGQVVKTVKVDGDFQPAMIAISRDGRLLAIFGAVREPGPKNPAKVKAPTESRVILWDLQAGKPRHVISTPLVQGGAFSTDGKRFAITTKFDIVLFDTATGKEERRIASSGATRALAFSPDDKTVAAGEAMNCIGLWQVATGEMKIPAPAPTSVVLEAQFQPGGKQLLTFSREGIHWWDVATGLSVRQFEHLETFNDSPVHGWPLSPDGKTFVTKVPAKGPGGDLVLLDTATKKPIRALKGDKLKVRSVRFSADGAKLFCAGGDRVIGWNIASGERFVELESKSAANLALSPDGRWLVSWANGGAQPTQKGFFDIYLWDLASGKLVRRLTPRYGAAFQAAFSADGTRLATVCGTPGEPYLISGGGMGKSNQVQLWDVATGKELRNFQGAQKRIVTVAISPDGRMIATGKFKMAFGDDGSDQSVQLWDAATGTERARLQGHASLVNSLDFSPDGRVLAAASKDAPIYLWDAYALQKSQFPGGKLAKLDQDKLWQALADADAAKAFQAVCELNARPVDAVAIFQDGWKQLPRATAQQMRKWIEALDSNQLGVRQKALAELNLHFAGHEQLLAKALEKANTLELRQRLEQILNRLHPEGLRRTRMLEVLERIGVGPARQLLQTLAGQTEDLEMSREAAAGLKRLP